MCSDMMNDDVLQPCTKQHFKHSRRVQIISEEETRRYRHVEGRLQPVTSRGDRFDQIFIVDERNVD